MTTIPFDRFYDIVQSNEKSLGFFRSTCETDNATYLHIEDEINPLHSASIEVSHSQIQFFFSHQFPSDEEKKLTMMLVDFLSERGFDFFIISPWGKLFTSEKAKTIYGWLDNFPYSFLKNGMFSILLKHQVIASLIPRLENNCIDLYFGNDHYVKSFKSSEECKETIELVSEIKNAYDNFIPFVINELEKHNASFFVSNNCFHINGIEMPYHLGVHTGFEGISFLIKINDDDVFLFPYKGNHKDVMLKLLELLERKTRVRSLFKARRQQYYQKLLFTLTGHLPKNDIEVFSSFNEEKTNEELVKLFKSKSLHKESVTEVDNATKEKSISLIRKYLKIKNHRSISSTDLSLHRFNNLVLAFYSKQELIYRPCLFIFDISNNTNPFIRRDFL